MRETDERRAEIAAMSDRELTALSDRGMDIYGSTRKEDDDMMMADEELWARGRDDRTLAALRDLAVLRDEMRERMEMIERMTAALADPDCENCEGSGMDYEGDEWTLCACSTLELEKMERVRAKWRACR